jgi:hypothetical protein
MTNIYVIQVVYMCRILKNSYIARLGRIIVAQAGILKPRPDYPRSSRNKPCKPAGPAFSKPAGPRQPGPVGPPSRPAPALRLGRSGLPPGWASPPRSPARPACRLGLSAPFPGWASVPAGPTPRLGTLSHSPAGPACRLGRRPGWALRPVPRLGQRAGWADALAGLSAPFPGWAGSLRPAGPDQEDPAWPGFLPFRTPSTQCSGRARPGFPGPGRITPFQAELPIFWPT